VYLIVPIFWGGGDRIFMPEGIAGLALCCGLVIGQLQEDLPVCVAVAAGICRSQLVFSIYLVFALI